MSETSENKENKNKSNDKHDKYIELNVFIKKHGLAATGGQAKIIIRSGNVLLNGTSETRNKKKLYNNDVIEYEGKKYVVKI
jgi:ribosome-associated protein